MGDRTGGAPAAPLTNTQQQQLGSVTNSFAPWSYGPGQMQQAPPQMQAAVQPPVSQPQYAGQAPKKQGMFGNAGIAPRDFGPVTPMGSFGVTKTFSPTTLGGTTVMLDAQGRPPQNYAEWLAARRS